MKGTQDALNPNLSSDGLLDWDASVKLLGSPVEQLVLFSRVGASRLLLGKRAEATYAE
jgi:hypothetical protein